jgi:hypothetical protein
MKCVRLVKRSACRETLYRRESTAQFYLLNVRMVEFVIVSEEQNRGPICVTTDVRSELNHPESTCANPRPHSPDSSRIIGYRVP